MKTLGNIFILAVVTVVAIGIIGEITKEEPVDTVETEQVSSVDTITLGAVLSLSGAGVNDGEVAKDGIDLAISDLRGQGVDIEVIYFDDKTDPKQTVSSVQLARAQGVDAMLGFTWDFLFNSAAPVLDSEKFVGLSPTNTSEYTTPSEYGFYLAPKTSDSRELLGEFLLENDIKTIAFMAGQFAWSQVHLENLLNAAGDAGAEVVGEYWMPFGADKDLPKTIVAEMAQQDPDAIFVIPAGDQTLFAITQAIQTNQIDSTIIVGSTNVGRFLKNNPDALADTYPVYSLVPRGSDLFVKYFEQSTDKLPGEYTEYAYDATILLAEALRGRGDIDLVEYLETHSFDGFSRSYSFDENHDTIDGLWQIRRDN